MKQQTIVKKIMVILKRYDSKGDQNPDWAYIEATVTTSVLTEKPLLFVNFTCSTINSEFMFDQKNPELYVKLDPKGNNLGLDLPVLNKLYQKLSKIYPVKVLILIGNTDPFYIYTQEWKIFPHLSPKILWKRFASRWQRYRNILEKTIQTQYPKLNIEVLSWYELEQRWNQNGWNFKDTFDKTKTNINDYYGARAFNWELNKLEQAFGPGKYFDKLQKPATKILKEWVRRKFAEYTVQGLWIKQIYPSAILLQNEKPSDLRTSMYQPLIKELLDSKLPVLYPYGVDNLGFQ